MIYMDLFYIVAIYIFTTIGVASVVGQFWDYTKRKLILNIAPRLPFLYRWVSPPKDGIDENMETITGYLQMVIKQIGSEIDKLPDERTRSDVKKVYLRFQEYNKMTQNYFKEKYNSVQLNNFKQKTKEMVDEIFDLMDRYR